MKIFCLGLSKTGTTSLTKALKILGYNANHFPFGLLKYNKAYIDKYDAFLDIPVVRFYQKLDQDFSGAKFIYLERNVEKWLDSCKRHFWPGQIVKGNNWMNKLHRDIYGSIDFDEDKFRQAYFNHDREIKEYFKDRPNDLLTIDITSGDGWEKLCPFLGREVPEEAFPQKDCFYTNIFRILNLQRFRK